MRHAFTALAAYQAPRPRTALWQFGSTLGAYAGIVAAMYGLVLHVAWWAALPLAIPAAGLVVRLFMVQHDCGHGSFLPNRRANEAIGWACSLVNFTPYTSWRRQHSQHHAVWNNLDRRDNAADIYSACITVAEYEALSPARRLAHRALHHPLVSQLLLPPLIFLFLFRVPFDMPKAWRAERRDVYLTDLGLLALYGGLVLLLGPVPVLLVQIPIMIVASIAGVWLFSVQHRFEDALWAGADTWTHANAALGGTSYLRLPRVLQWFTGNVGFHHVHHLFPRVPNYRLEEAHRADPSLEGAVTTLTLREAFRAPSFALWDEAAERMVPFPRAVRA